MKLRKKTELHVVGDEEEIIINRLLTDLEDEDASAEMTDEQRVENKKKRKQKTFRITAFAVIMVVLLFLGIYMPTYSGANTMTSYHTEESNNNSYLQFAKGVLKYSRDGMVYLNRKSEEIWNHPYQIKNPIIETYENMAAIADKGGNAIVVFDDKGIKGEVQTSLPIEKLSVSAQGIVSALLKNENSPLIVCYDAAGNMLVELKTSFASTGYPMDISISEDGTLLLVSYMYIDNGTVMTKVVYYSFAGEATATKEFEVSSESYEGMIAPAAFFMNESVSAVVGDDRILLYKGKEVPELHQTIILEKEIKSIVHNERYIGLVLKNEGKAGYELCLYNTAGRKVMSKEFTGEYSNMKIDRGQVLMYAGKKCCIFTRTGIHRFEGEIKSNILEIFPVTGLNKYIVMSENGMEVIRLAR